MASAMSGATDFEQVRAKFSWAAEQLAALHEEVVRYVDGEPYGVEVQDKPESQAKQLVARLLSPVPARVSLLAADFLSNADSTLDYIAWQLVLREGGVPGRSTYFPLRKGPVPLDEHGAQPGVNVPDIRDKPALTDPLVLAALEEVQPYFGGQDYRLNFLFELRRLSGESKHRRLPVLASAISIGLHAYKPNFLPKTVAWVSGGGRLKDGDELAWIPYQWLPEGGLPDNADLTAVVELEGVADHDSSPELVAYCTSLCDAVGVVVDRFAAFFDE